MKLVSLRVPGLVLLLLFYGGFIQACGTTPSSSPGQNLDDEDDDEDFEDEDDKDKKDDKDDDEDDDGSTKSTKKEPKVDTTVVRRQMTNISDKITRAQSNLQRTETLRNSAVQRLEATRSEMAQANLSQTTQTTNGVTTSNGNVVRRTKAELAKLVTTQEAEVKAIDAEVKAIENEINQLEAELDTLTLKLEKTPAPATP